MDIGEWKKEIEKIFDKKIEFEKVPQLVKRCPKCGHLSLEFDMKTGRVYCIKCGFEEHLPQIR